MCSSLSQTSTKATDITDQEGVMAGLFLPLDHGPAALPEVKTPTLTDKGVTRLMQNDRTVLPCTLQVIRILTTEIEPAIGLLLSDGELFIKCRCLFDRAAFEKNCIVVVTNYSVVNGDIVSPLIFYCQFANSVTKCSTRKGVMDVDEEKVDFATLLMPLAKEKLSLTTIDLRLFVSTLFEEKFHKAKQAIWEKDFSAVITARPGFARYASVFAWSEKSAFATALAQWWIDHPKEAILGWHIVTATRGTKDMAADFFHAASSDVLTVLYIAVRQFVVAQHGKSFVDKFILLQKLVAVHPDNSTALFLLGFCHFQGHGTTRDSGIGWELWGRALQIWQDQGGLSVVNLLGSEAADTLALHTVIQQWYSALRLSWAVAGRHLAIAYENGQGVIKNQTTTLSLFRQSAIAGDRVSQYRYAMALYYGVGVESNHSEALSWMHKAALFGDPDSQYRLAQMLLSKGRNGDAVLWFSQARDKCPKAKKALEDLEEATRGTKTKNNASSLLARARKFLDFVCEGKERGEKIIDQVRIDLLEAATQVSTHDSLHALLLLGDIGIWSGKAYCKGMIQDGLPIGYYIPAASLHFPYAQISMGCCFALGLGVEHDLKRAAEWWKKAIINEKETIGELADQYLSVVDDLLLKPVQPSPQEVGNALCKQIGFGRTDTWHILPTLHTGTEAEFKRSLSLWRSLRDEELFQEEVKKPTMKKKKKKSKIPPAAAFSSALTSALPLSSSSSPPSPAPATLSPLPISPPMLVPLPRKEKFKVGGVPIPIKIKNKPKPPQPKASESKRESKEEKNTTLTATHTVKADFALEKALLASKALIATPTPITAPSPELFAKDEQGWQKVSRKRTAAVKKEVPAAKKETKSPTAMAKKEIKPVPLPAEMKKPSSSSPSKEMAPPAETKKGPIPISNRAEGVPLSGEELKIQQQSAMTALPSSRPEVLKERKPTVCPGCFFCFDFYRV